MTDDVKNEDLQLPTYTDELVKIGVDGAYIARKHKRELNAKKPEPIKIKGAVTQEQLPKGWKIVATSGFLVYDKEGGQVFGDGETIIQHDVADMGIRQNARKDAHKLRGDYPAETVDHTGGIIVNIEAAPIKKKKRKKEA